MFFSCQVNQVCLAYILVVALLGCVEWQGILVYYDRIPQGIGKLYQLLIDYISLFFRPSDPKHCIQQPPIPEYLQPEITMPGVQKEVGLHHPKMYVTYLLHTSSFFTNMVCFIFSSGNNTILIQANLIIRLGNCSFKYCYIKCFLDI